MPCSPGGYSTVYQCKHDRRGYKLMRVAIHPSRCYAEWWGHTLGFKAAGSLSIHATLATWNAHHAWKVRAEIPRCVKSICKIKTSVLYTHLLTWENCKQNQKNKEENWGREKKYVEFESLILVSSSLGVLITGSKQTAFMSDVRQGNFLSRSPWRVFILLLWLGGTWSLSQESIEKKQDVLKVSLVPLLWLCPFRLWLSGQSVLSGADGMFYSTVGDKVSKSSRNMNKTIIV